MQIHQQCSAFETQDDKASEHPDWHIHGGDVPMSDMITCRIR